MPRSLFLLMCPLVLAAIVAYAVADEADPNDEAARTKDSFGNVVDPDGDCRIEQGVGRSRYKFQERITI